MCSQFWFKLFLILSNDNNKFVHTDFAEELNVVRERDIILYNAKVNAISLSANHYVCGYHRGAVGRYFCLNSKCVSVSCQNSTQTKSAVVTLTMHQLNWYNTTEKRLLSYGTRFCRACAVKLPDKRPEVENIFDDVGFVNELFGDDDDYDETVKVF